jgi:hypothetical protein
MMARSPRQRAENERHLLVRDPPVASVEPRLTRRLVEAVDQIKLSRISHGDCGLNAPHSVVSTPKSPFNGAKTDVSGNGWEADRSGNSL